MKKERGVESSVESADVLSSKSGAICPGAASTMRVVWAARVSVITAKRAVIFNVLIMSWVNSFHITI